MDIKSPYISSSSTYLTIHFITVQNFKSKLINLCRFNTLFKRIVSAFLTKFIVCQNMFYLHGLHQISHIIHYQSWYIVICSCLPDYTVSWNKIRVYRLITVISSNVFNLFAFQYICYLYSQTRTCRHSNRIIVMEYAHECHTVAVMKQKIVSTICLEFYSIHCDLFE